MVHFFIEEVFLLSTSHVLKAISFKSLLLLFLLLLLLQFLLLFLVGMLLHHRGFCRAGYEKCILYF
jgi:hypothetical protein